MSSNTLSESKETSFKRQRLTIAESLLRPLLSKLKLALLAVPPTHPCFAEASKRDVIEFFDEFFDGTEMPFTDNKASIDKQYKDVMEVMGDMDPRIKLLESVCLRSTSEASAAVRVDLYNAIGWWRQAFSRMYEADGDSGLGDGLGQVPEDE